MNKLRQSKLKHVFLAILLAFAMVVSYFAGTISVEARFVLDEILATTNQTAAVYSAVSLLLLGNAQGETLFLPLMVR